MNNVDKEVISLPELLSSFKSWLTYLSSKFLLILFAIIAGGIAGILYAHFQQPIYTAEITFAPENENTSGAGLYSGIAAQFGLDIGGGSGSVFEGDNLIVFLKSKMLIEKALFSNISQKETRPYLINYYIKVHKLDANWKEDTVLSKISFKPDDIEYNRKRDSILIQIINTISENLEIQKINKNVNIIVARMKDGDELFAKLFVEQLVIKGINYYVDYRSKKTRDNVNILQRQTDSVRSLLSSNIASIASTSDLNINPTRQIVRTGILRKQLDAQVNEALYTELVKNLELSKLSLRKETPLVQIIDKSRLPLEKKKMGRFKGGIIFGLVGFLVALIFLVFKKILTEFNTKQS